MVMPGWEPGGPSPGVVTDGGPRSGPPEVELRGTFLVGPCDPGPSGGRTARDIHPAEAGPETLELILDASIALLPFHFLRTGDRLGRAVVKILRGDGGAGTGFLVAPGILLTNHHVLPDVEAAGAAIALANFEAAPPGSASVRPASVPLDPDALFVANAELDFTFCAVRGLDLLGSIGLDRNSLNVGEDETVNIIQHPRGRPKEVALRDNRVIKADSVVLHYACSTEPGSSGSPVFNNQWETVALHHASVQARGNEGLPVAGEPGDSRSRYINEGIRISAIALWLETAEANAPAARDQVSRLRGIIAGIDPRVGFFGALGRKAHGRAAPEVVGESYRGETDDIDLAFWNVRGLEVAFREQMADIGRVVADMGMDLWCLAHADDICVAALCEHLEANFRLDYEYFHEPAGAQPALALLYRRGKALVVERRTWGVDVERGADLPPLVTVRASTRRSGPVAFQLVPVGRLASGEATPAPHAEAIREAIRRGHGEFDWIVIGDASALLAPEKLQVLADCDREILAAAADRDGAVALLTGPRSRIGHVFLSPNLRPALGAAEAYTVTRDRELPPLLRALGGHQPIALRLTLEAEPRPAPAPPPPPVPTEPFVTATTPPAPPAIADDDLERRIKDVLGPLLARLLAENRPQPGGPG